MGLGERLARRGRSRFGWRCSPSPARPRARPLPARSSSSPSRSSCSPLATRDARAGRPGRSGVRRPPRRHVTTAGASRGRSTRDHQGLRAFAGGRSRTPRSGTTGAAGRGTGEASPTVLGPPDALRRDALARGICATRGRRSWAASRCGRWRRCAAWGSPPGRRCSTCGRVRGEPLRSRSSFATRGDGSIARRSAPPVWQLARSARLPGGAVRVRSSSR